MFRPTRGAGRSSGWPGRLEALTLLGDRARVEQEAPPLASTETVFAPFALRALGLVRGDEEPVREAAARFRAMGLDWHADQSWVKAVS